MTRQRIRISLLSLTLLLGVLTASAVGPADLLFYEGWENGRIPYGQPGAVWKPVQLDTSQIVTTPVRAGDHAVQFSLDYAQPWILPATELRVNAPATVNHFRLGQTYWYGFSIYVPDDTHNDKSEIVNQFHGIPDTGLGESWGRNPPFFLALNGDRWQVMIRADAAPVTVKGDYDVSRAWDLGPWQAGQWTDWVYQIKWSPYADGFTRIWQNGKLVLDYHGPNTFNDQQGPFWKIGIYEWAWKWGPTAVTSRTLYYDEIRIGDAHAGYDAVAPGPVADEPPPPPAEQERVIQGLQALYTFAEGGGQTVRDVSGVGNPLPLKIADATAVAWRADGLTLTSPTLLSSGQPAGKIQSACQASGAVTLEAWITPANVTQDGPARILTMSADPYRRNFTLGQGLWGGAAPNRFDARLRTTATGDNGQPSLSTAPGSARTALTHLVYTRSAGGGAVLYVNGQPAATTTRGGSLANWAAYPLALGNELSGGRPWLGTYHLAAVYCRALSSAEVAQNYAAGHRHP